MKNIKWERKLLWKKKKRKFINIKKLKIDNIKIIRKHLIIKIIRIKMVDQILLKKRIMVNLENQENDIYL